MTALIIDLESQHSTIQTYLKGRTKQPQQLVYLRDQDRHQTDLPKHILEAMEDANADGIIVSTEPSAHQPYLRWGILHNKDVLTDKPPVIPTPFGLTPGIGARIRKQMDDLLVELAAKKREHPTTSNNAMAMVQRRAHAGYGFIYQYLKQFVQEWQVPISFLDVYHADGMWCMPQELMTREYHPYKYGYGKMCHSGYHFLDVLVWLFVT